MFALPPLPATTCFLGALASRGTELRQLSKPARASWIRSMSSLPWMGTGDIASVSTSGMFMPLITVMRSSRSINSTIELLTLDPIMSVQT